jgi:hypothetical protein
MIPRLNNCLHSFSYACFACSEGQQFSRRFNLWSSKLASSLLSICLMLLFGLPALGVAPSLTSISPTGGQRGTEMEVSFNGDRLEDAEEIICYEPGLQIIKLNSVTNKTIKAQVKLMPDCQLGEYHLRVRTKGGLSELRTFFAGPFPVVAEIEPNNHLTNAQKIAINTTLTGVVTSEDVDCFVVEVKKGQRISAEVEGIRLGRAVFDSRLTVMETNRTLLADSDDTWLGMQDPFISVLAPHDGAYIVQLRESTYGGSDNSNNRLHIGSFPRPAMSYTAC